MMIAVCSAKGSPGVTTTTAVLATTAPRRSMLFEADPSGGTLVAWWAPVRGVSYEPGLISLAATRDPITTSVFDAHSQPVSERARLVAAPPHPRQVRTALASIGERANTMLATTAESDVFVDCGRIDAASPAMEFVRRADATLLVMRPRLADISVAETAAAMLRDDTTRVLLVCVGDGPYAPSDVSSHLGLELAGVIADDPRAAEILAMYGPTARGLSRSRLWRTTAELSRTLTAPTAPIDVEHLGVSV